jgi:ankyrin repeat protein
MDHILSSREPRKQRMAFKTVPRTLDVAYNEVMQRIESSERSGDKALALKIFSWLYRAMRNLSMDELLDALAVDQEDDVAEYHPESDEWNIDSESDPASDLDLDLNLGEMPSDGERLKPTDVVECCKGLVLHEPGGLVRFIHDTVRVFVGKNLKSELPSEIHLAKTCLTYLMFPEFEQNCLYHGPMKKRVADYKFGLYAAQFWGIHVRKVENLPDVQETALKFLTNQNKRDSMLEMEAIAQSLFKFWLPSMTLIHVIAKNGLVTICRLVLCGGPHTDIGYVFVGGTGSFNYVRTSARIPILSTLPTTETDVNAMDYARRTPLYYAAELGHREMAQLLLDQGADVHASEISPLQAASHRGHASIVQLLLDQGADVNASRGFEGAALYLASKGGHRAVVQLLLEKGADVNATGDYNGNALQVASERGHASIVQLLLDQGADVNVSGACEDNPRVGNCPEAVTFRARSRLDQKEFVNLSGGDRVNALYLASKGGHSAVVQLLLEKGADVNATGGSYGNALQGASAEGHEAVVKLLLNHGADMPYAQGGHFTSALEAASADGHEGTVQLLRKHMNRR